MVPTSDNTGKVKRSTPNPVDIYVGSRVRMRRTLLGMSQEKLGEALRLTFQQVQKYERGANRIGASRLHQISRILDVPIAFFFDDLPPESAEAGMPGKGGFSEEREPAPSEFDPMAKRETLELVRAYYRITDPRVRKRIFELVKSVAGTTRKR